MTAVPRWVQVVFAHATGPVPLHDVIRSAITVPLIVAVSYALAGPQGSLFAAIAAMLVVLSERSGTTGQRAFKSGAGLTAGVLAMTFGPHTAGTGLEPFATVVAFGLVAGVLSGFGAALSFAAMQMLVQMSIAGGLVISLPIWERVAYYAAGGLVALAAALAQSWWERTDQLYGQAIHQVSRSIAAWPQNDGPVDASLLAERRHSTDESLAQARDLILTARPARHRRQALLQRARQEYAQLSIDVTFLIAGQPSPLLTTDSRSRRISDMTAETLRSKANWNFVLRLEICLAIGEIIRQLTALGHGYWILLTIALTLKPDLAPVFARTMQRAIGTIIGVAVGWIAVVLAPGYEALPVLVVLGAAIPFTVRRSYGWFSVIITPQIFLILDLGHRIGPEVLGQRILATAIGSLVVLTIGNAFWPATWTSAICRDAATLHAAVAAFPPDPGKPAGEIAEQRLRAAMAVAALRARLRVRLAEPAVRQTSRLRQAEGQVRELESILVDKVRNWAAAVVADHAELPLSDSHSLPDSEWSQARSATCGRSRAAYLNQQNPGRDQPDGQARQGS